MFNTAFNLVPINVAKPSPAIPDVDIFFGSDKPFPPGFSYSRASQASYFDAANQFQFAANNVPRYDGVSTGLIIEGPGKNYLRNPRAEGAVVGTPGTFPTNWAFTNPGSLIASVVGTGTEDGLPYVDIRFAGTAGATTCSFYFETQNGVNVTGLIASPQRWFASAFVRLMAGSVNAGTRFLVNEYDAALANITAHLLTTFNPTNAALRTQRSISASSTTVKYATIAYVQLGIRFNLSLGVATDFTMRFAAPQLEAGAMASSVIFPPAGAPAVATRAPDLASIPFVTKNASPVTIGVDIIPIINPNSNIYTVSYLQLDQDTETAKFVIGKDLPQNYRTTFTCPPGPGATGSGGGSTGSIGSTYHFTGHAYGANPVWFAMGVDGTNTQAISDTSGGGGMYVPAMKTLRLGNSNNNDRPTGAHVKRIRAWRFALLPYELGKFTYQGS